MVYIYGGDWRWDGCRGAWRENDLGELGMVSSTAIHAWSEIATWLRAVAPVEIGVKSI